MNEEYCGWQFRIDDLLEALNAMKEDGISYVELEFFPPEEDDEEFSFPCLNILGLIDGGEGAEEGEPIKCVTTKEISEKAFTQEELDFYDLGFD